MENLPDETLMAYADGALPPQERARVEAILAMDETQRRRLEPFVVTRLALPSLFSEALTSGVPDRLVNAVLTAPIGTRGSAQAGAAKTASVLTRLRTALFPEMRAFAGTFALAASVALIAGTGFVAGHVSQSGGDMQTAALDDEAIAAGALQAALDTSVSDTVLERGLVRVSPVMTFRDTAGRYCRQYSMVRAGKDEFSGFACKRSDGRWSVAFHAPVAPSSNAPQAAPGDNAEGFKPAGDSHNPALQQAIDKAAGGIVLNSKDEARLIAKGWPREAQRGLDDAPMN